MEGHSDDIRSVDFSPDGSRIVTGSRDKLAIIWDAKTGSMIGKPLKGHSNEINCVNFFPDGTRIITGSDDNLAIIWDSISGT